MREGHRAGLPSVLGRQIATVGPANRGIMGRIVKETAMNEEELNMSVRKFLKMVGVSSQREIEQAVARALQEARIAGTETLPARMTLEVAGLRLKAEFDGEIRLEAPGAAP
jgi:hypothetical protein